MDELNPSLLEKAVLFSVGRLIGSRMSIEIFQFPRNASKQELAEMIRARGFVEGENPFFPGPPGTVHFFWSEPRDFKSTSGVDASVMPLDGSCKAAWNTTTDWWLRTRTSIWASTFDRQFQNETVRAARKQFGGTFYNDHFGHNRYIRLEHVESTPVTRGLHALFSRLSAELRSLEAALPEELMKTLQTPAGVVTQDNDEAGLLKNAKQHDPSRVVYNALVPFLVAALEHMFREAFEILLKYDNAAKKELESQNRKLSYAEGVALVNQETTLERIASGWYSFQNLESTQKAFKEILGIDVWKILRRRRRVRAKLPLLSGALQNLIGTRHGVVHHFSLDRQLDREGFLQLLHLVRAILDTFQVEMSHRLRLAIGPG